MKKVSSNLIQIDAGNLVSKNPTGNMRVKKESQKKARLVIKYYNKLGWTALNMGEYDFIVGLDSLLSLRDAAKFPFISANIVNSETKEPIFKPSVIIEISGYRVGVTGVSSYFNFVKEKRITVIDPVSALRPVLTNLAEKTDFIIVAAAVNDQDQNRICNTYPDIDLMVRANSRSVSKPMEKIAQTYVSKTGTQGKYLGVIELRLIDPRLPLVDISRIEQRLKYIDSRLKNFRKEAGDKSLEEYFKDSPGTLKVINNLRKQQNNYRMELEKSANTLRLKNIRLDNNIPSDEDVNRDIILLKRQL